MKKVLLGTTALFGAVALAGGAQAQTVTTSSPFTVTIGGFFNFTAAYVTESNTDGVRNSTTTPNTTGNLNAATKQHAYTSQQDSELWFTVSAKADNGLTYGFRIELETDNSALGNSDEASLFLQSATLGRLELGNNDGSSELVNFVPSGWGPGNGDGYGPTTGLSGFFLKHQPAGLGDPISGNANYIGQIYKGINSSDAQKLRYDSPVFAGFKASFSFAPDGTPEGARLRTRTDYYNSTTGTVTPSASAVGGAALKPADANDGQLFQSGYKNFIETSLVYSGTFGPVGLAGGIGYNYAAAKKSPTAVTAGATCYTSPASTISGQSLIAATGLAAAPGGGSANVCSYRDINTVYGGLAVTYAGFTVGGQYDWEGKSRLAKRDANFGTSAATGAGAYYGTSNTSGYAFGVQYATGPWTVGAWYQAAESEGNPYVRGKDKIANGSIGANYLLAPGLVLYSDLYLFRMEDEGGKYMGLVGNNNVNTTKNSGSVFTVGTAVKF